MIHNGDQDLVLMRQLNLQVMEVLVKVLVKEQVKVLVKIWHSFEDYFNSNFR